MQEVLKCIDMIYKIYKIFGFKNIIVHLSTKPKNSMGNLSLWIAAESFLKSALIEKKIKFSTNEGEGAFYGPKIEFTLLDSLGRQWQCGTIQLDFLLAQNMQASYIDN